MLCTEQTAHVFCRSAGKERGREAERAALGGARVCLSSIPQPSSSTSLCGAQCLSFLFPTARCDQSLLVVSATAFSAPLSLAFLTSIGLSLKLHSRSQSSYFYPLQTCLLHKLEKWSGIFFLPNPVLVGYRC